MSHQRQQLFIPLEPHSATLEPWSIPLLRPKDNQSFLGYPLSSSPGFSRVPKYISSILPTAIHPVSQILNHPNIISLVDITSITTPSHPTLTTSLSPVSKSTAPTEPLIAVFENMTAGPLSALLPSLNRFPYPEDALLDEVTDWDTLAQYNPQRFSLHEDLCWHVLESIGRALMWLHHGIKETPVPTSITSDANTNDALKMAFWDYKDVDWCPILIRDVSPEQIYFQQPDLSKGEKYGKCKLGGFRWAIVTGGKNRAFCPHVQDASSNKRLFWPPEIYAPNPSPWTPASELYSLGATVFMMMTGTPPVRSYTWAWNCSRICDRGFSAELRSLVGQLLKDDPEERGGVMNLVLRAESERKESRGKGEGGRT